jgi:hypothetical protein
MAVIHNGSTGELLAAVITPGRDPVTLICPFLPTPDVLDQAVIVAKQHARQLRIVTSLYGPGSVTTRKQLDSLIHLCGVGVKVKAAERSILPSILLCPPSVCCILPNDWGRGASPWHRPIILDGAEAQEMLSLGERVWKRAATYLSRRRLQTAARWLDEVEKVDEFSHENGFENEVGLSELTLFDKRRGRRRSKAKKDRKAWWTFHGTADNRINPFLPVYIWAAQREAHRLVRFPKGKRPTGVKAGDSIFFVVYSRNPAGDNEAFVVGCGRALAYRPLIDDASEDEQRSDEYLARYPHALRLERVVFIRGAVGEGTPAYGFMNTLGAKCFESTLRNFQKKSGNIDPHKSVAQKTLLQLSDTGASATENLLEDKLRRLGGITAEEIIFYGSK